MELKWSKISHNIVKNFKEMFFYGLKVFENNLEALQLEKGEQL